MTGPLPAEAQDVADEKARLLGIQHRRYGKDFSVLDAERGVGGWLVTISGAEDTYEDVFLPLHGRYQLVNLATAVAAAEAFLGRRLEPQAVEEACAVATMPGRMEPLATSPLVMVDGAHNADGISTLVDSLVEEFPSRKWHIVFGVMGDKNLEAMLERLAPITEMMVVTAAQSDRAVHPADLARVVEAAGLPVVAAESVPTAIQKARKAAGSQGSVLVTGSLYLVGEVRDVLAG